MRVCAVLSLLASLVHCALGSSIMGIDLGSQTAKVGLVSRGSPLQIVTNMHSKRKTENMILFDDGSRFYGADASSLVAKKPKQSCQGFNALLGR